MLELPEHVISPKLMVESRVVDPHTHAIHTQVVPNQEEPTILHCPETNHRHHVTTVFQVTLEQVQLPIVQNLVIWAQPVVRNLVLANLTFQSLILINYSVCECQPVLLVEMGLSMGQEADRPFVSSAEVPFRLSDFYV